MNFNFKNIREVYKVAAIQMKRAGGILQVGHLGFRFLCQERITRKYSITVEIFDRKNASKRILLNKRFLEKGEFTGVILQNFNSAVMTGTYEGIWIVNCAINVLLSYTAITLNTITILALRKTSLSSPLKTLLLSLAVSDLGVGLLVQPLYVATLVMESEGNFSASYNFVLKSCDMIVVFLCVASFLGVMALSVDRFLAIHLHLRYQAIVTHKRVVASVVFIWVVSAVISQTAIHIRQVTVLVFGTISVICLISSAFFYYKIYVTVQRHTNQIQVLQLQPRQGDNEMVEYTTRLKKAAIGTFYVYLVFLICNLPNTCILLIPSNLVQQSADLETILLLAETLVFLNSSLNPLIYCWKMRHIRQAIMAMLRKIYLGTQHSHSPNTTHTINQHVGLLFFICCPFQLCFSVVFVFVFCFVIFVISGT